MNEPILSTSRREFIKTSGRIAAASALAAYRCCRMSTRRATELIQVALVGCGGRGTGAAGQAMSVTRGPVKLKLGRHGRCF